MIRLINYVLIYILLSSSLSLTFLSCKQKIKPGDNSLNQNNEDSFQKTDNWWKAAAENMVLTQIISEGVKDKRVIDVMKNTPRHLFVPNDLVEQAYDDGPLPIGYRQTISQPLIVAMMTELLELTGKEKVLEIGTGSGYQAAIISQLADTCYTIEIVKPLADSAKSLLERLGYDNIIVKHGDGYKGWIEHAPFDCIIITAAPPEIPEELVNQLKIDGRMIVPVGEDWQELILITKTEKGIEEKVIASVLFVPMVHPDIPISE